MWNKKGGLTGDEVLTLLRTAKAKRDKEQQKAEEKRRLREEAKAKQAADRVAGARELEKSVKDADDGAKVIDHARAETVRELLCVLTGDESKRKLYAKEAKQALKAKMEV